MKRDKKDHINKIRSDFDASLRVKDSLNNSIQALAKDLYSKDTHFIFELIQNAEDNEYHSSEPSLSFYLTKTDPTLSNSPDGALIIQNNETGFSTENVEAICAVGKTTKSKIKGYIGEKGIGFKSVFRVTKNPHIFSNGYCFCLPDYDVETGLGYIVPKWVDSLPRGLDPHKTSIVLPLNENEFGYDKIEKMLRDIEAETILFLPKLKELQIRTDSGNSFTILKDDSKKPLITIIVEGIRDGETFSNVFEFLLHDKSFLKPTDIFHEKRDGIEDRLVTIAFPIDEGSDSYGKLFAYLPVRSDSGLPFLMNADFILTSSREDIQRSLPWNKWLMNCIAELVSFALPNLRDEGLLTVAFLEKLSTEMIRYEDSDSFFPIVNSVRAAFLNKQLLPASDDSFISATEAKLARGTELRDLLNAEQLQSLFMSKTNIKWLSAKITRDLTPNLRQYLIEQLNITEIRPGNFIELLSDDFLEVQDDNWLIEFYSFLYKGRTDLWKKPNSALRKKKFLRLENGQMVSPLKDDGTPNAYRPTSIKTNFPTIKENIYMDETAADFLKSLGLIEPDLFAEIIGFILPKYAENHQVHRDDNIEDIRKIGKFLTQPMKGSSRNILSNLIILLNKLGISELESYFSNSNVEKVVPVLLKFVLPKIELIRCVRDNEITYKAPNDIYVNTPELRMYFRENEDAWFVCDDYPVEFNPIFIDLGINQIPKITKRTEDSNGFVIISKSRGYHKRGINGFDPDIEVDGLEKALYRPTIEKSEFIWNTIVHPHSNCIRGIIESSSRKTYEKSNKEPFVSHFGRLLVDTKWLPKGNDFVAPGEISLDDLPETFIRDEKLADQLEMLKDLIADLAEQAGVSLEALKYAKLIEDNPYIFELVEKALQSKETKPAFPTRNTSNPVRREEKISEQIKDASDKKYEPRTRSVRIAEATQYTRLWLREQYTNNDGQMVCQICKNEMPFRKRHNNKHYFEAVEALSRTYFSKEHEAQFLALCPLCAAMYKEFIKNVKDAMDGLKMELLNTVDLEVPIALGSIETSVQFVQTHILALKTILAEQGAMG